MVIYGLFIYGHVLLLSDLSTVLRRLWSSPGFIELCGFTFVVLMFATGRGFKIMSLCSCSYHIISLKVRMLSSYTDKLLTDRRTGGQTQCLYGNNSQQVVRVKKIMWCQTHVKKDGQIELKHLLQFNHHIFSTQRKIPHLYIYMLILALTSKTGQSVARNTHIIFYQKEDIFRHFIGLISDSIRKGFSR